METIVLALSDSVALNEVRCSESSRAPGEEEQQPSFSLAVTVAGVYVQHVEGRALVGAPGVGLFMNPGDVYRTAHPAGCGDRTLELTFPPDTVEPFTIAGDVFPDAAVPIPPRTDLEIRGLARSARRDDLTALDLDVRVQRVIAPLVGRGDVASPTARSLGIVDRALEYLAWHFSEDADLPSVAHAVGCSPHHLSRLFHAATGITLSGYRTELRVRAALERIELGAADLSAVASDVGFFDQAHMTKTFRRVLGRTPSNVRKGLGGSERDLTRTSRSRDRPGTTP